jgi:hypothetical protein
MQKRSKLSGLRDKENQDVIGQRPDKAPVGVSSKCCGWADTDMGALSLGICFDHCWIADNSSKPLLGHDQETPTLLLERNERED